MVWVLAITLLAALGSGCAVVGPTCVSRQQRGIDSDYPGISGEFVPYEERTYQCDACGIRGAGYNLLQQSPPEFLLQPHDMYPMNVEEFARWLAVVRAAFPTLPILNNLGVTWYPGPRRPLQDERLSRARRVGTLDDYRVRLSSTYVVGAPLVIVTKRRGEAMFSIGDIAQLERSYFGFDEAELAAIPPLLEARRSDIYEAAARYANLVRRYQLKWLDLLASAD